jgi:Cu-Zn family superoxide dismutase
MGKAAGGHWNPTMQNPGKWGSASFHSGDIGNINLDANGNGSMQLETDLWSIPAITLHSLGVIKVNVLDVV